MEIFMLKIGIQTIIIITLSTIIGIGSVVTGNVYKVSKVNRENASSLSRDLQFSIPRGIFIIESTDPISNLVHVQAIKPHSIGGYEKVVFKVTESTLIEKQHTVVENGLITNLTTTHTQSLQGLVPGAIISVQIGTNNDGELIARKIILDIPFEND